MWDRRTWTDPTLSNSPPNWPIPKVKAGSRSSAHIPDPWPYGRPSRSGYKAKIGSRCSQRLNQLQLRPYINITSTNMHRHWGPNHFIGNERAEKTSWTAHNQMDCGGFGAVVRKRASSVLECGWTMTSASANAPLAAGEHQWTYNSQQNGSLPASWNRSGACNTYSDGEVKPHTWFFCWKAVWQAVRPVSIKCVDA